MLPGIVNVIKIISFALASWVLLHLMAVFGVFISFAYPLWWFLAPHQTICFICKTHREGATCPICHRTVKKGIVYPDNFVSAILNACLLLVFSFIFLGMVFLESKLLYKLGIPSTPKTASFVIPTKNQYEVGQEFTFKIELKDLNIPINTVQADISFDPNILEAVDITTSGSFANIFIQKEIDNKSGFLRLTGGLPNPGFKGPVATFGNVIFKGKNIGPSEISYLPTSLVLANDGRGTNILKDLSKASFLILPKNDYKIIEEKETSPTIENVDKQSVSIDENYNEYTDKLVLGESDTATQMFFLEETNVLGSETKDYSINTNDEINSKGFFERFLEFIVEIDQKIISFWFGIFINEKT